MKDKGDEGYGVDDDDDDDDSGDDIEYFQKEVGLPFINWLDSRITSYLETAPAFADFEAHQVHWQNFFSSLSKELEETNEASQQLTTPPMPELEIEFLDARRGKSCPCCLDEDRYSQGRLFAFQEESGITKSVFIKLLGNALYAGHGLENYRLFGGIYEGRLVIKGFDWMMGSPYGDLWGVSPRNSQDCIFIALENQSLPVECLRKIVYIAYPIAFQGHFIPWFQRPSEAC